mmetsp:Transcript_10577/g.22324  ORF Transcript_10577/g.22324 Transcript_10577/m.22324 type:complete len:213 (-) Transcript_10577:217-855(-)
MNTEDPYTQRRQCGERCLVTDEHDLAVLTVNRTKLGPKPCNRVVSDPGKMRTRIDAYTAAASGDLPVCSVEGPFAHTHQQRDDSRDRPALAVLAMHQHFAPGMLGRLKQKGCGLESRSDVCMFSVCKHQGSPGDRRREICWSFDLILQKAENMSNAEKRHHLTGRLRLTANKQVFKNLSWKHLRGSLPLLLPTFVRRLGARDQQKWEPLRKT